MAARRKRDDRKGPGQTQHQSITYYTLVRGRPEPIPKTAMGQTTDPPRQKVRAATPLSAWINPRPHIDGPYYVNTGDKRSMPDTQTQHCPLRP